MQHGGRGGEGVHVWGGGCRDDGKTGGKGKSKPKLKEMGVKGGGVMVVS